MSNYKIERRGLPVRILGTPGWVSGRLHLPVKARLLDFLDHAGAFVSLTEVQLTREQLLPFLALHRNAIFAVVPPLGENGQVPQESSPHQISMLIGHHVIRGQLRTLPGVRISDFLLHHHGFVRVEDASVREQHGDHLEEHFPVLMVNCERVVGVAEAETAVTG